MNGRRAQSSHASRALGPGSRLPRIAATLLAAAVAMTVAGCGSSSTTSRSATVSTTTIQTAPVPKVSKRVKAEERAVHRQVSAALHHHSHAHYGGVPKDIRRRQAPPANQVLSATAARPADAIQGVSVRLHLAHGTALATVVGPEVPNRIQGTSALHTPAVWDLTFADVHGTIPIAAKLFSITDEQGQLLAPRLSVPSGPSRCRTRYPQDARSRCYSARACRSATASCATRRDRRPLARRMGFQRGDRLKAPHPPRLPRREMCR